jgi:NO-binding membrane sensor protein with MHYT domain
MRGNIEGLAVDFTYDKSLVALSIAVAMLGSFTGLVMTTGIRNARGAEVKLRIILGGVGIGGGIWSMHFISMLAVILPIRLSYDIAETAISAIIAVIFTATALAIVSSRRLGRATLPISALFLGLGIGGMHYLGMHAIRGGCTLLYSWIGVSVSVAIAIQASGVALWFTFRQRGVLDTFLGSMVLGLAIASMHYSGMEATRFLPVTSAPDAVRLVLSENYLAFVIAVTQYVVCATCLVVFAVLVFRPRAPQPDHLHRQEYRDLDLTETSEEDRFVFGTAADLDFVDRRLVGFAQNDVAWINDANGKDARREASQ